MRTTLALALSLALTANALAAPRKPKASDPAIAKATIALKLARARAKVTKATTAARKAIGRADAAIERCEQAIVDVCMLQHPAGANCEDLQLGSQFAACHSPARAPGWTDPLAAKYPKASNAKLIAFRECLTEVDTDDEEAAAERCAGELE